MFVWKRKKSCKIRVTCWLGFICSFPKWSTCTNTAPITWRSNVFPVLVLFTKDSKHWCFPSNGRNKMDSLQVKERVTWWAWNVAGCRSRNVLRFAMADAVASRWKPNTFSFAPPLLFNTLTLFLLYFFVFLMFTTRKQAALPSCSHSTFMFSSPAFSNA